MSDNEVQKRSVRNERFSTGEQKHRDEVLPTTDVTQEHTVETTSENEDINGTATVLNTGAVPSKSIVTRVEVNAVGGTATAESYVEGTAVATDYATIGNRVQKTDHVDNGGVHVIPDGGSMTVNVSPTDGGTITSAAVNVKLAQIE